MPPKLALEHHHFLYYCPKFVLFVCLCWGLTSQSTIFQSCRDGATASWVIKNQYFRGVKCLAQGHNTAMVGFEPPTSRSRVRHSTTEPPHSPPKICQKNIIYRTSEFNTPGAFVRIIWASSWENLYLGFPTRQDSNQPAQLERPARVLKFQL